MARTRLTICSCSWSRPETRIEDGLRFIWKPRESIDDISFRFVLLLISPRALQGSIPRRRIFPGSGARSTPWSSVSSLLVTFDRPCIPLLVSPNSSRNFNFIFYLIYIFSWNSILTIWTSSFWIKIKFHFWERWFTNLID